MPPTLVPHRRGPPAPYPPVRVARHLQERQLGVVVSNGRLFRDQGEEAFQAGVAPEDEPLVADDLGVVVPRPEGEPVQAAVLDGGWDTLG